MREGGKERNLKRGRDNGSFFNRYPLVPVAAHCIMAP